MKNYFDACRFKRMADVFTNVPERVQERIIRFAHYQKALSEGGLNELRKTMKKQTAPGMLRYLRAACALTRAELADEVGATCKDVIKWEGGISVPDGEMLQRLAVVLGCSVDELIFGETYDEDENTDV